MSAAEIEEARRLIKALVMPDDSRRTRRFSPSSRRARVDARRSFRRSLQPGGAIDLEFRRAIERPPAVVALCDISGSMSEYTRLFLHFLHALGETRRVSTFLLGARLTNVTRAMRSRDPDEALAQCAALAIDWSGGTRIGEALTRFNRDWSRRVLAPWRHRRSCSPTNSSGRGVERWPRRRSVCADRAGGSSGSIRCCNSTDLRPRRRACSRSCRTLNSFRPIHEPQPAWPTSARCCPAARIAYQRIRRLGLGQDDFRPTRVRRRV